MHGKTKLLLILVAVVALVGLGSGGAFVASRVANAAPDTPDSNNGTFVGCGGFGFGPMMGGFGGMMWGGGVFGQVTLDKIAKLTGISSQDILSQLQSGKSLVEITQGKATEQQLVDTIVAPQKEVIALRVKQGYLTQEQADQMIQQMTEAAKNAVNSKWQGGWGGFGPHGGFGPKSGTTPGGPSVGPGARTGAGMMGGFGGYGGMMGRYQ